MLKGGNSNYKKIYLVNVLYEFIYNINSQDVLSINAYKHIIT